MGGEWEGVGGQEKDDEGKVGMGSTGADKAFEKEKGR